MISICFLYLALSGSYTVDGYLPKIQINSTQFREHFLNFLKAIPKLQDLFDLQRYQVTYMPIQILSALENIVLYDE